MDIGKIEEFMNKNVIDNDVKESIMDGIKNNIKLQQLIGIPLMATRLVEIVVELKEFPQSEGAIIGRFIQSLYKREIIEKKDTEFDEQKVNYLVCDLAEYSLDKYHTNSGMSKVEVIQCFANCMNRLCFSYDSVYVINKLIELGVLECENDIVVFAHQAYQDYYYSQAKKVQNVGCGVQRRRENIDVEVEEKNKSENIDFYKEKSKEAQYEKSTIYLLHSYEGEQSIVELLELMKNNLYLAAKVISSGNYSLEVEERAVKQAVLNIQGNNKKSIIQGFLTLLELNRYNEIIQNKNVFVASKRSKYMINSISMHLDSENMLMFFEALLKTKESQIIAVAVNSVYMREYEYIWNSENSNIIERVSADMKKLFNADSRVLYRFYISFNVPKVYIDYNVMLIDSKLKYRDTDLAEKFIQKYNLDVKMQYDEMCKQLITKDKWTSAKNSIYILSKMSSEERVAYLKMAIAKNNTYLTYYVFNILSAKQQSKYLRFYEDTIKKNIGVHIVKLPIILSETEAEEIIISSIQ